MIRRGRLSQSHGYGWQTDKFVSNRLGLCMRRPLLALYSTMLGKHWRIINPISPFRQYHFVGP